MTDWVLDIETDGVDATAVKLVGVWNANENHGHVLTDLTMLMEWFRSLKEGDKVITFNGCGYDLPVLHRLWCIDLEHVMKAKGVKHLDLLIIGKMIAPDRGRGYSLKAWAEDAGQELKDEVDFDTCTMAELAAYCIQDCKATYSVYKYILSLTPRDADWKHAIDIEHQVARIVEEQKAKRVKFDLDYAEVVLNQLEEDINALTTIINASLPTIAVPPNQQPKLPVSQFKKDGTPSVAMQNYAKKHGLALMRKDGKWALCGRVKTYMLPLSVPLTLEEPITINQSLRVKDWLLSIGWEPTIWNTKKVDGKIERTSPRMTDPQTKEPCPNLAKCGFEHGDKLAEYYTLAARRANLLNEKGRERGGLIGLAEQGGGFIASDADTVGTPTARFRHRGIVNIPRVTSTYGKEFRALFRARPGMVWVGWDASGLEARMEAHYTYRFDGGAYAREILEGDIHTANQRALGLASRDLAKTFKYAVTYGASPRKLAGTLGCTVTEAQRIYDEFWNSNEALKMLKIATEEEWNARKQKWIIGLDRRLIATRSKHSLVNSKFQSGGAIVMKHAMILAERMIHKEFSSEVAYGLIRYHDEEQWECLPDIANRVGELGVLSIKKAGEYLGVQVELDGEYKVGNNWAETH